MTSPKLTAERPYARRSPVSRFFAVGRISVGGIDRTLWGFMSFYNGLERPPIFAAFAGTVPVDSHGNIRTEDLKEGTIIVEPGLIYNPIPPTDVTGKMMAEHDRAMKIWKPKTQIITERSDAPAVDMGVIHMPGTGKLQ